MRSRKIAVIGGTGLNALEGVSEITSHEVTTEFGTPSSPIFELQLDVEGSKIEFLFLPRHGSPHAIAPHLINYRANIAALHSLGVEKIIAVNAVGGIDPALPPKSIVLPHQVIDYTHSREASFFDGTLRPLDHFDFSDPIDVTLLKQCTQAAQRLDLAVTSEGVYGVTQGPRLETAAEIRRMAKDGATLVGMTLMPEAILARELKIAYASICLVVNPAAGVSNTEITMDEIHRALKEGMGDVHRLVEESIRLAFASVP